VVSHRQNALVNRLLEDVQRTCPRDVTLVVTENIADPVPIRSPLPFVRIVNPRASGFGANHNAAFARCQTPYYCVCNPDVRLTHNPFPALLQVLGDEGVGIVGPAVRDPAGELQDSARRFPTAFALLNKLLRVRHGPDYPVDRGPQEADWVAGMFMLFRADAYRALQGFDEGYFLYYEDVDICRRMRKASRRIMFQPAAEVIHDARRGSRRKPGLALHHLRSALRFFSRS
jgi:GT2 family glycosyltransferase